MALRDVVLWRSVRRRLPARIVNQRDFLVVGRAAILATFDDDRLPYGASRSDEADLAPYDDPDGQKSLQVEGSLGWAPWLDGAGESSPTGRETSYAKRSATVRRIMPSASAR